MMVSVSLKAQQSAVTRKAILTSGLKLFAKYGFSTTSIDDIARAAGITKGAVYWHFRDKADLFAWLRDVAISNKQQFDVVILDPAKMTRDREQVIPALKKYLDMNKLAMAAVKPGGVLLTCSCTGLVDEASFLDSLRRAAFYANRTLQVLEVRGAGPDHPFLAHAPESRFCTRRSSQPTRNGICCRRRSSSR